MAFAELEVVRITKAGTNVDTTPLALGLINLGTGSAIAVKDFTNFTLTANFEGVAGNDITLHMVAPSGNAEPSVVVTGNNIVVNLRKTVGALTTTGAQLQTLINEDDDASALVTASEGNATVLAANTITHLAGGADPVIAAARSDIGIKIAHESGLSLMVVNSGRYAAIMRLRSMHTPSKDRHVQVPVGATIFNIEDYPEYDGFIYIEPYIFDTVFADQLALVPIKI